MSSSARASILETFRSKLNNEWKYSPRCGLHEYCTHKSDFIRTGSLQQWMKTKQGKASKTNVERLYEEINVIEPTFANPKSVFEGDKCCVLVFSILLMQQDFGRLVLLFQDAGITDKRLDEPHYDQSKLRETLKKKEIKNIDKIIHHFSREKWAFCPASLTFCMDEDFHSNIILPFCALQSVNDKGGTALVLQVAVQEEFVSDEIKEHLGQPFGFENYGECYQLAVKSYSKSQKETYDSEVEAFKGLHNRPGMVRYFGCYSHQHGEGDQRFMYHIVLELGRMDLIEYFYGHHPPELPAEIVRYWKSICKIAEAIRTVHQLAHGREIYYGWHGDVKPDNILLVENEWKLADFGYAKFRRAEEVEGIPKANLRGGTDTYGSPEFAQAKLHHGRISTTRTIDTWSFGCVLSVVATWIVLGAKGIEDFVQLRQQACRQRKLDAFHDGENVLPEIKHWHDHLRTVMRRSDIISADILGLIEEQMLKEAPSDRLTSEKLCKELDSIIVNAESRLRSAQETRLKGEYEILETHDSVRQALLTTEKARNSVKSGESESHRHSSWLETSTAEGPRPEGNALPISLVSLGLESTRSKKSRKREGPLESTSHRGEVLEQELASRGIALPAVEDEQDPSTLPSNTIKGKKWMNPRTDPSRPSSPQRLRSNNYLPSREAHTLKMGITNSNEEHDGRLPNKPLLPEGRSSAPEPPTPHSITAPTTPSQPIAQVSPQIAFQNPPESSLQPPRRSYPQQTLRPNSPHNSLHLPAPSLSSGSPSTAITPINSIRSQSPPHHHQVPLPTVLQNSQTTSPSLPHSPSYRSNSVIPSQHIWNAIKGTDENALTLCRAILTEDSNVARVLDDNGRTPVMIAAHDNNMAMVSLLLPHSLVLAKDVDGRTMLHHAVSRPSPIPETKESLDIIGQIIGHARQAGVDIVNIADNNKQFPLYYCVKPNMLKTAEFLIKNDAWINPLRNSDGKDVFIEAVKLQKDEMVRLFLEKGAKFEWPRLPNHQDIPDRILFRLEQVKPRQKADGKNKSGEWKIKALLRRK